MSLKEVQLYLQITTVLNLYMQHFLTVTVKDVLKPAAVTSGKRKQSSEEEQGIMYGIQ